MRPILFQWHGLTIRSYHAMIYLGLLIGVAAGNFAAHASGLNALRTYVATMILIGPGLLGARLLHVALHWRLYRQNVRRIWNGSEGGGVQYGGVPVVLSLSVPVLWMLGLPFGAFWDVALFTFLVTVIFGRLGCLLNGCCSGRPSCCWISVSLPNASGTWETRLPTQLLEAGWAAILLILAASIWRWMPFPGALFLAITACYAAGRIVFESTREFDPRAGRFNFNYGMSVMIVVLSLALLTAHWPR
jgi:phosphatidylglycerol:prolipoprotein diacylglycerol transferase